ncbi:MAG: type II toxin-antitoxin system prevent-host-death family antitoxin [Gammaproteobacteria bacterium]|jgi:antitoxin StbD
MHSILANFSASITEFKKQPSALIKEAKGETIAILSHNTPIAYLIPADTYEEILELIEDCELAKIAKKRAKEKHKAVDISIDEL